MNITEQPREFNHFQNIAIRTALERGNRGARWAPCVQKMWRSPARMAHSTRMLLTESELGSLIHATHRCPHQLLGMHPLGDGSGVVARALLPNAAKVEL